MALTTLADVLAGSKDAPAILGGSSGSCYTRGQLDGLVRQFAATLALSGIGPGDVVTIVDGNTVGEDGPPLPGRLAMTHGAIQQPATAVVVQVEFIVAFLGATLARAAAAPLTGSYTEVPLPPPAAHGCPHHTPAACAGSAPLDVLGHSPTPHLASTFLQDEFKFYLEDAGSKLLVLGKGGNAAAEAAAEETSTGPLPVITLAAGQQEQQPALEVTNKGCGAEEFELRVADAAGAGVELATPAGDDVALFLHTRYGCWVC